MTTDLIKLAAELGYSAEPTAGGHIRFVHPSGALVHSASTPSDHRALRTARADLRRELRARSIEVEVRSLPPRERERARKRPTPRTYEGAQQSGCLAWSLRDQPREQPDA
jgi:hypothetical protein